ncbi:VPS10 domain-containing protein [Winogradskyella ouciana]|uniref:T9SS type A sorting domain-containing protein n=1 Tax=Winogradskyella ouciana TaxID=2608631 RepID=A0A7K1GDB2_9FLAO|nr:T9SS type A sorting domain-containing protein [Winogradskyella ouciana]MTE27302.1 T9SS type A sorting domain-containing protein [Winogradskyella ouciana]
MKKIILLMGAVLFAVSMSAQDYHKLIAEGTHTVEHISEVAESHFDSVGRDRGTGYKPFKRWQYFAERAMDETGKLKSPEYYYNELQNYNARINDEGIASRTVVGTWEEMGPTYWSATSGWNPGVGRITSIAIDESNMNHIIAGSETGGVWKSTDGGSSWTVLTDNLANIDVYALAIDPLNSSTYYWGSNGGTIFKSTDGGSTWTLHGSLPAGFVNKILVDPTNTSKIYASAQSGGLYKSTDGGSTWTIIDASATTGYDFEFKPGDPNTVYASGSQFYVSTDGGTTFSIDDGLGAWTQEFVSGSTTWTTSDSNQNNTVSPRTGNKLGFFYISNFSTPVTRLVTPSMNLSGAVNPQVNFSYTQVNWAGDIDELRVLYKTSVGGSWIELAHYTAEVTSWADITINLPNPSSDYYVAFEGTSNYGRGLTLDDISVEANNLGVVFSEGFETSSNEFGSGPKMIGVSPDDPSVVYVVEASSGVFGGFHVSSDNGNTFTKRNHSIVNYFGYDSNGFDSLGQAPRDMDITVNPNDVNDVHIAGINTWRSTDAGVSFSITSQWTPGAAFNENIGYCHADVDLMMFAGTGANAKLFVGTDGGIYVANDPTNVSSSYYTDLTPGMGIRQFYKIGISQTDPVVVTGGSQDNGTSTMDVNGNWKDWLGADGMEGFVDKDNIQTMYGTLQFGSLYKTSNGGSISFSIPQPDGKGGQNNWNWVTPLEQDPISLNTLYVAFDEVYRSVDGGSNWISISQNFGANIDHFKVAPTNSSKMYLAINGAFWYSTNGGSIWTQSSLNLNGGRINEIAVHPTNPDKIAIATTNSEKVYVSTNNGLSWTSMRWDLPNFSSQALAWQNNGDDGLYVGMNYGVYYTDNGLGNTWLPFNNGLPNVRINELEINTADNRIYAATYGRGLWRSNVYDENLSVDEFEFNDFTLYPNPANNEVNLKWNKPDDVSVRIYNTLGKIVFYGKKVNLQNGFKIDVSPFDSGLYFVKLNSDNGEITKKLILK